MIKRIDLYFMKRETKIALLACLLFWAVGNAYGFFSIGFSHDGLLNTFGVVNNPSWENSSISLGRFLLPVFYVARGSVVSPWIMGVFSLLWQIGTVLLIIALFDIRKRLSIILVSSVVTLNPSIFLLYATYNGWADAYACAVFLAVLSLLLIKKSLKDSVGKPILFLGLSVLSLFSCLGIYQANGAVFLVLGIIFLIEGLTLQKSLRITFKYGCMILGVFVISCFLWFCIAHLLSQISGVALAGGYNGIATLGYFDKSNFVSFLLQSFTTPLQLLGIFSPFQQNAIVHSHFYALLTAVSILLAVCIVVAASLRSAQIMRVLFLFLLLFLLPFACGFVILLSQGTFHELEQTGLYFSFIGIGLLTPLVFSNKFLFKICGCVICLCLCFQAYGWIVTANKVYVSKHVEEEAGVVASSRLLARLDEMDGYIPGETPVILIGENVRQGSLVQNVPNFESLKNLVGLASNYPGTYTDSLRTYFNYYLGQKINIFYYQDATEEVRSVLDTHKNEINKMPDYPEKGSLEFLDGYVVIHMDDN